MRPLFRLLKLQGRGFARRLLRGLKTPRGAIFLLLGVAVIGLWMLPSLLASTALPRRNPADVRAFGPFLLLALCVTTLIGSASEKAIAFTPAEVDLLFAGPFSRRQLLGYKLAKNASAALLLSLIMSIILLQYATHWLACYFGAFLGLMFIQLFSMTIVLVGQTLGERAYSRGRRLVAGALVLAVVLPAIPLLAKMGTPGEAIGAAELAAKVRGSLLGMIVLAPFDAFIRTLSARAILTDFLPWVAVAAGIDLLLMGLVIWLDANYLEAVADNSRKFYARVQRARRGPLAAMRGTMTARWRLGRFPWLGGAGPIAWRQMTNALRNSRGLLMLLAILSLSVGLTLFVRPTRDTPKSRAEMVGVTIGVIVWVNLFFASILKFDFRDELDHMDWLKSLPLRPWAVALGELAAPTLVMTAVQLLALVGAASVGRPPPADFLLALPFTLPFNLLLFGIENLLFLLFPSRLVGLSAGDLQLFGRQALIFAVKLLLMAVGAGLAAIMGVVVYMTSGQSQIAGLIAAWLALAGEAVALLPAVAWAFRRFDPGLDMPA